nr:hypothetical protein [uncultured Oscillibacter sp.]
MKNFQNYTPEKYAGPAYTPVEEGIYLGKNPYWQPGFGQEEIYVTSLSFEMEPERFGEEGGCPQDITQTPFEDILDTYLVYVTDFYDELNQASAVTCYQEFGSGDIQDIRNLRGLIGKRFYAVPCEPDDPEGGGSEYKIVIE